MSEDVSAGRLLMEVVADTTGLRADLKAKADAAAAQVKATIRAQIDLDVARAKADIEAVTRDRVIKVKAAADTAQAKADLDRAAGDRTATIRARADTAQAKAELDAAARTRTATIKAKADTSALSQIENAGKKAASALSPVALGAGLITAAGAAGQLAGGLVAVTAAAAQAAGVVGALPGLLSAAAQAGGTLLLGFSGVTRAVSAYTAAQASAKTSAVSAAQQIQSAQDQVRTSQQALVNAQVSGAEQSAQAQHAVQQAVTGVADAQYNAAQSVTQAEHTYTDALFSEKQAQLAVAQARQAARQNLIQTAFDLRDAALGEKQAALTLHEARTKLEQTNQSAASTADQKQQALLDYQQAQLAYDESANKSAQAAKAKHLADKQGVSGSQQVVTAVHDQADALFALRQAAQASARAQVEAVRSVAQAQYQEAQAEQALSDQRRTGAQQLLNAEISYREALKAARAPTLGVSSAQTALNTAMAGLTPAGRTLVRFIDTSLIPRYKELQKATAGALLPGVTSGLRSALPVIGTIQKGLTGTGKVLGRTASRFGAYIGSAGVRSDLSGVMAVNTRAVGAFADGALRVIDVLRNVSVAAEPLVTRISAFADKAAATADAWSKSSRDSGSLAGFFGRAATSAGQLLKITEHLLGFLGHLIGAAAPSGSSLLGSFVTATGKLDKWSGSGGGQARMERFFTSTVPVVKQFGDLLVKAAGVIGQLAGGFGGGELDGLFTVLNLALNILSTLTKLPGFGQLVQWILILSGTGAGLGLVASKIGAIGKGLSLITKFTGLDKLVKGLGLGDTAGAAAGSGLKRLGGKILGQKALPARIAVNGAGEAEQLEATAATGLRGAASAAGGWLAAAGQGALSMAGTVKKAVASAGTYLAGGVTAAKDFAVRFGSGMVSAAGSAVSFVAGLGSQLAAGAKSLAVFIGEHAAAAGAFIAANVTMAASATAAFIAENAATLGIVAALALLVAGIVYVATHWSQVWGDIKRWAKDAWDFIYNGIGKYLLILLGPAGLIIAGLIDVSKNWSQIWSDIRAAASDAWRFLKDGAHDFVSGISQIWHGLESAFAVPVNFLINTVYDNGIRKFWNAVVSHVGLGKLDLPRINPLGFARGGIVPGTDRGRDEVMIAARPQEGILVPGAVRAIGGPGAVHALNRAHGGGQPGDGSHFAGGGIVGGVISDALDIGKAALALATGNSAAFVNALMPMIGTTASGALGRLMIALPVSAMRAAAKAVLSLFGGTGGAPRANTFAPGSGPAPAGLTSTVQKWFAIAVRAAGVPASWIPGLETIAFHESGYNPGAINNTPAGIAAGTPEGEMQTIPGTFAAFHVPGTANSPFDPVADIAAAARYIREKYGTPEGTPGLRALAVGRPYSYYDGGGPLRPGPHNIINATGRDEWVLTPRAVDLLGGPRAVEQLNAAAGLYRTAGTATAVPAWREQQPGGRPVVNVYPQPGQSEEHIGQVAARKLGLMLA